MSGHYEEKIPVPFGYRGMVCAAGVVPILALLGMNALYSHMAGRPMYGTGLLIIVVALLVIVLLWSLLRPSATARVVGGNLLIGPWLPAGKTPLSCIDSVVREELKGRNSVLPSTAIGEIRPCPWYSGPGVRRHWTDAMSDLLVPASDPEALARALGKELLASAPDVGAQ